MEATMQKTATLQVGDPAPDFTLEDQDRNPVTLSSFQGRKHVVLVFHPLAFTSICSIQMPGYNRELQTFEGLSAQVLGISVDSSAAHRAWAEQLGGIDYPMLADFFPHGEVARRYGVLRPEGYSERATIIVDRAGIVRFIDIHAIGKVPDQDRMVEFLRTLQ
jgi:peroxiredoxin (alkyl hydroperoxide reductase subunit C)